MIEPIENSKNANENQLRVQLERLNQLAQQIQSSRNPSRQTDEAAQRVTPTSSTGTQTSDSVSINPAATLIAGSGVNKTESKVVQNEEGLKFNLQFNSDHYDTLHTKGTYNPSTQKMDLSLNFNFKDNIRAEDGTEAQQTFQAKVKLKASNVSPDTFNRMEGKGTKLEQIVDGFMAKMLERAYEKEYPPTSVVLNLADVADLVSENGEAFQRVSRAMMLLNKSLARALEMGQSPGAQAMGELEMKINEQAVKGDGFELDDFSLQLTNITGQSNMGPLPGTPDVMPATPGSGAGQVPQTADTTLPGSDPTLPELPEEEPIATTPTPTPELPRGTQGGGGSAAPAV